ncbi:Ku protein [Anaerobranca gottschalkii]|uniref:Non-homologous end joining protein Ku n=1 Tax=Anaerobranca gottschalkii DSM 13577 TaxID=1120990 RepID=A0A1I0BB34_9FIRM|nr:Ku protein [Anaerobranca gottschalkii]SET04046.1 DNA end-binding protein Ku [Anaerobranca gottschalkii DSM 13577]
MKTLWKGAINFGLINVPIKMFTATENKSISFKNLHKECNTPIKQKRYCPNCEKEVEYDEIVKGYEYQKDTYIIIKDEDLEKIPGESSKTIDIVEFVKLEQIDPIYFDKSYYLAPEDTGKKAYKLLVNALNETEKIAIAKVVIRSRESLVCLRVYNGILVMETMHYPDEIRNSSEVPGINYEITISDSEIKMAKELIEGLATDFNPEKYQDNYRTKLLEIIQSKVEGKEIKQVVEKDKGGVIDLMEALQASLDMVKKEKLEQAKNKSKKRSRKTVS